MLMIDPVCCTLFGHSIRWYGVMMAAAFTAGLLHLSWLARKENRDPNLASDLAFWLIVGGIIGARLAYVLSNWTAEFAANPWLVLRVDKGGLVFYGGFFGAILSGYLFSRIRKLPALWLFDFTLTALPLGHALGRLGCFINGCCHGTVHHGWCAVTYPRGSDAWSIHFPPGSEALTSLPVWPVQLFEALANVGIYFILRAAYRRPHATGAIVALYFALYAITRFSLEFLRGDLPGRIVIRDLTSAQWVSIGLFAAALLLAYGLRLKSRYDATHRSAR